MSPRGRAFRMLLFGFGRFERAVGGGVRWVVNKLLKFGSIVYPIMGERQTSRAHELNPHEVHLVLVCVTLSLCTGCAYRLTEL